LDSGEQFRASICASADCLAGSNPHIPCVDYFNSGHEWKAMASTSSQRRQSPEPKVFLCVVNLGDKTFVLYRLLERMGGIWL